MLFRSFLRQVSESSPTNSVSLDEGQKEINSKAVNNEKISDGVLNALVKDILEERSPPIITSNPKMEETNYNQEKKKKSKRVEITKLDSDVEYSSDERDLSNSSPSESSDSDS